MDEKLIDKLTDEEALTLTVYGEARNQGLDGMLAVAAVILNRAKKPSWWGHDIKSVCFKAKQFSCWNDGDPNAPKLVAIAEDFKSSLASLSVVREVSWIVKGLLQGFLKSNIGNSTHYHTSAVSPDWKYKLTRIRQVGDHVFYV